MLLYRIERKTKRGWEVVDIRYTRADANACKLALEGNNPDERYDITARVTYEGKEP